MNGLAMRSRMKPKDILKQVKMRTQEQKNLWNTESNPKRQIHSLLWAYLKKQETAQINYLTTLKETWKKTLQTKFKVSRS